jgi:hypothetical protein
VAVAKDNELTKDDVERKNATIDKSSASQKRHSSGVSTPGDKSKSPKKRRKIVTPVTVTAASSTINSMSAKLNNCLTKVV